MGIIKQAIVVALCLLLFTQLSRVFETKLPINIGGTAHPDFQDVADEFRNNVESGKEPGAAFAVYYNGELIVDLWGGYADNEAQRPWSQDTTSLVFSCSKGVAAIVVAKLVQDGVLDYEAPVSKYWPHFGQAGKDNITVEMLVSHQAGLARLDNPLSIYEFISDPDKVVKVLEEQKPLWPPGTQFGYHAMTFGFYVDQLVQHADPKGRDMATIFQEEIAIPNNIDFHMNLPLHLFHRTARLYPRTKPELLWDALFARRYLTPMYQIVFKPDSLMAGSVTAITEFSKTTSALNNPYFRQVTMSSMSCTGTARGLAKLYAIIANEGNLDGKTVLNKDYVKRLATPVKTGYDVVMETGEYTSMGPGTLFRDNPKGETTVGHTGHGGQVAVADLKHDLGIVYLSNHLSIHGVGEDPRFTNLEAALYKCIDRLKIKTKN